MWSLSGALYEFAFHELLYWPKAAGCRNDSIKYLILTKILTKTPNYIEIIKIVCHVSQNYKKDNFKFRLRFIKHYTKVRSPRSMTMEKSIGATITTLIRISEASFIQNNSAFQMSSKTFPRSTTVAMRIA